ncbi:hypothetical protein DPMN_138930 [Dreissena polymorpha]|uniref:Uncharacterized protein n=1 Tax=Dreissena polymorpha TaxID=45954 RepID=A0A9D4G841_DREPO|nr:hypothetical protein DPMN_138930 [Dreissena polymorpha]
MTSRRSRCSSLTKIDLNIEPLLMNTEIIMRLQTNVINEDLFFTDQNGYTLMGRRNNR